MKGEMEQENRAHLNQDFLLLFCCFFKKAGGLSETKGMM